MGNNYMVHLFLNPLGGGGIYLDTKRNIVAKTLAVIFLVSRVDTPNPRHLTSDPAENTFGSIRVII